MLKILLAILLMGSAVCQIPFDLTQMNKYNNKTILETECNIQTQIDYFFNANSKLSCDGTVCTSTSP